MFYIENCPYIEITWQTLLQCLVELGITVQPERILVHDDLETDHYSFQGSPSVKVDGVDLWEEKKDAYHLGIRVYSTPAGLSGSPTKEMIMDKLRNLELITGLE